MRIEIYGGGGGAVASYQNKLDRLYDRIDDTIEALQSVNQRISNVNGPLNGNLQSAQTDINHRIEAEERKKNSVVQLQQKSDKFFENTVLTDKRVADTIMQNEKRFYEKHPHLAPAGVDPEKIWDWILEKWEGFCDTAEQIWNGIVEFVKEHAVELIVGAVTLAIAAVITFLSGGALAPLVVGVLQGMLISGLFGAAISLFTGGDIWDGFLDGLAQGFMWGGIFALASSILNVVKGIINGVNKAGIVDDVADDIVNKDGNRANTLEKNRTNGKIYEQQEFAKFKAQNSNAVEQVTIKTKSGVKTRVDAIGIDANGNIIINEFKSSATASLTTNQKIAFDEIMKEGGTVVGEGKGIFKGGFKIPAGTEIKIIRPK